MARLRSVQIPQAYATVGPCVTSYVCTQGVARAAIQQRECRHPTAASTARRPPSPGTPAGGFHLAHLAGRAGRTSNRTSKLPLVCAAQVCQDGYESRVKSLFLKARLYTERESHRLRHNIPLGLMPLERDFCFLNDSLIPTLLSQAYCALLCFALRSQYRKQG